MSLEKLFHEFTEKYKIPKKRIKENIEKRYREEIQYYLENYEWPHKRGSITSEEGVAYYFRSSLLDKIQECDIIQKITGVKIPIETITPLFEKSKRLKCYRLAKIIRKVCKNKLPEVVMLKRHEEPSTPMERILRSLQRNKSKKTLGIDAVISEIQLENNLKELADSKDLDKEERIQAEYRTLFKKNHHISTDTERLNYSLIQIQKLYEKSKVPFEKRTVKLAYNLFLKKENTRLEYANVLDYLSWLKLNFATLQYFKHIVLLTDE